MNSTEIKDYIVAILMKTKSVDEVPAEHIEEVQEALEYLQKIKAISPEQQAANRAELTRKQNSKIVGSLKNRQDSQEPSMDQKTPIKAGPKVAFDSNTSDEHKANVKARAENIKNEEAPSKEKMGQLSIVKMENAGANAGSDAGVIKGDYEEVVKIDNMGQWSIEKAIKPGPTLDYSKANKPKSATTAENTIDYAKINKPKNTEDNPVNTLNYNKLNTTSVSGEQTARDTKYKEKQNTMVGGTPEKNEAAAEMARRRAKLSNAAVKPDKTALESIAERNKK